MEERNQAKKTSALETEAERHQKGLESAEKKRVALEQQSREVAESAGAARGQTFSQFQRTPADIALDSAYPLRREFKRCFV